jgi:SlyX protein
MPGETDKIEALVARTDTLETTIAYQAEAIEDLNRTIKEQWKVIDGLKRSLNILSDQVQEAESRSGLSAPEPPPPHY